MKPVSHGEPYPGKLHVRFDEGAGVPDDKGRPALLYPLNPADEGEVGSAISGRTAGDERRAEEDLARIVVWILDSRQERLDGGCGDFPDGL